MAAYIPLVIYSSGIYNKSTVIDERGRLPPSADERWR